MNIGFVGLTVMVGAILTRLRVLSRCCRPMPVTSLVDGYYAQIQSMGGGGWDTSSLLKRMQRMLKEDSDRKDLITTGADYGPG